MPAVPIGEELFREVFDHLPLHDLPEHDGRALQARQRLSDRIVDVQNDGALGEIAKPAICAKMRNRCGQLRRDFQQPDARQVEERGVELDFARATLVRLGRCQPPVQPEPAVIRLADKLEASLLEGLDHVCDRCGAAHPAFVRPMSSLGPAVAGAAAMVAATDTTLTRSGSFGKRGPNSPRIQMQACEGLPAPVAPRSTFSSSSNALAASSTPAWPSRSVSDSDSSTGLFTPPRNRAGSAATTSSRARSSRLSRFSKSGAAAAINRIEAGPPLDHFQSRNAFK